MGALRDGLLAAIRIHPGLTDRELADRVLGPGRPQQTVNQTARALEARGVIQRRPRQDGRIGNFVAVELATEGTRPPAVSAEVWAAAAGLSEDVVKAHLEAWLNREGWSTTIRWGHDRGIDIDARRRSERLVIEVKGCGSRPPMRVNYFLGALGELLQRMDDPAARYAVAFPDMPQYRGLWARLPALAKQRTGIVALFVRADGQVEETQ